MTQDESRVPSSDYEPDGVEKSRVGSGAAQWGTPGCPNGTCATPKSPGREQPVVPPGTGPAAPTRRSTRRPASRSWRRRSGNASGLTWWIRAHRQQPAVQVAPAGARPSSPPRAPESAASRTNSRVCSAQTAAVAPLGSRGRRPRSRQRTGPLPLRCAPSGGPRPGWWWRRGWGLAGPRIPAGGGSAARRRRPPTTSARATRANVRHAEPGDAVGLPTADHGSHLAGGQRDQVRSSQRIVH